MHEYCANVVGKATWMHAYIHVGLNVHVSINAGMGYDADYISRAGQIH